MSRKRVPDSAKKDFARRLIGFATDKGWDQSALAREVNKYMPRGKTMGRDAVSHYWNAIALPIDYRLLALARALAVKPQDLVPSTKVRESTFQPIVHIESEDNRIAWVHIDLPNVPIKIANKIYALLEGREMW